MHSMVRGLPFAVLLCMALPAGSQTSVATNAPAGKPLSERIVDYSIDATVDPSRHTVDGTQTLTYRNLTGQPLQDFPFHLYLNAFRPDSTFAQETLESGSVRREERKYPPSRMGGITISSLTADGFGELTRAQRFTAPDDGNFADHTVMEVHLPQPVMPGDSITFRMAFHDQFPESIARNGYKRDFMMGGQWFPKLGVFWHGAWNCHQYHATTEFFSDFGTYRVRLTVPENYTVGASGVSVSSTANRDGTKTLGFYGEDIHDFAWAASPNFTQTDDTYLSSMGPVRIHVLAHSSHPRAGARYAAITKASMAKFEEWYGPYPYKQITVVDPEPDSAMEGMEYPTLFTAGTSWWAPQWNHDSDVTVEHEFGHQYWQGMVATNEFEEAWLDEGINSYTEVKVMEALFGRNTSLIGSKYANMSVAAEQRLGYLLVADYDPLTRPAWLFRKRNSYGGITYGKTATVLLTLEGIVGTETMRDALRTYFTRYRFAHPTAVDFLRTLQETAVAHNRARYIVCVSCAASAPGHNPWSSDPSHANLAGTTLSPFLEQAVYGTAVLDYAVDSLTVRPAARPQQDDPKLIDYTSTVVLHRIGDFLLPVTVEVTFSDGSKVREHWDGVDRWRRFSFTKKGVRSVSAEVDPDQIVPLDKDLFNNSYSLRPNPVPARKLTAIMIFLQQCLSQFTTWIV